METQTVSAAAAAILSQHGAVGYVPRQALAIVTGCPDAGNHSPAHTGRDVATLRCLGIQPIKIAGRWVVPAHAIARYAVGFSRPDVHTETAAPARRDPGRPRKSASARVGGGA